MRWSLLLACSLVMAPLAGCLDGDGGDEGYSVSWEQPPSDAVVGEPVEVTWRVDGPEGQIPHTGVHFSHASVQDPQTPADYGNTSGAQEPAQIPDSFSTDVTFPEAGTYHVRAHAIVADGEHRWSEETMIQIEQADTGSNDVEVSMVSYPEEATSEETLTFTWELEGDVDEVQRTQLLWGPEGSEDPSPDAYENTAGTVEQASVPASYDAELDDVQAGEYHARAHARVDGEDRFSQEVTFTVSEASQPSETDEGEEHDVAIDGFAFEPSELTVQPGDTITWENHDGASHTVTFDDDRLGDSGSIASGQTYTLTVPEDLEAGSYGYVCDFHPSMQATITVETS